MWTPTHHVGDHHRCGWGGRGGGQTAPFDLRQMRPDGVHLLDRHSALLENPPGSHQIFDRETGRRNLCQSRASPRDQEQHRVFGTADERQEPATGGEARTARIRMIAQQDLQAGRNRLGMVGDDEPAAQSWPKHPGRPP